MNDEDFKQYIIKELAEIKIFIKQYNEDIKNLKSNVYGNGKIGLKTQVFILWSMFIIISSLFLKIVFRY